jgi:pimeloyl-ACP methyl ester carboxylesterase
VQAAYPDAIGLSYEDCVIETRDAAADAKAAAATTTTHAWLVKAPGTNPKTGKERCSEAPTIMFFHGNAGNISHRLENVHELVAHTQCNVLMIEYRGYGLSSGTPHQVGWLVAVRCCAVLC